MASLGKTWEAFKIEYEQEKYLLGVLIESDGKFSIGAFIQIPEAWSSWGTKIQYFMQLL